MIGHSSKVSIIAGAIGGTAGLLFILIVLWFFLRLRKKSKKSEEGKCITMCVIYINISI